MSDIREELKKISRNDSGERKRKYFLWKNGLDTIKTEYSKMNEEEFREFARCTELEWNYLVRWEESEDYKRLMYILYRDRFDDDLLEVYDSIKEEAKNGNATAVKTMLTLQKTIKNKLKTVDNDENKPKLNLQM